MTYRYKVHQMLEQVPIELDVIIVGIVSIIDASVREYFLYTIDSDSIDIHRLVQ